MTKSEYTNLETPRIARTSLEMVLARAVGSFALFLFCLSLPDLFNEVAANAPAWNLVVIASIPASILWTVLASRPDRRLYVGATSAAGIMIVGFFLWHIGLIGRGIPVGSRPWSSGVAGAGIALAAVGLRVRFAAIYGLGFSLLVLLVPLMSAGNTRVWFDSMQDALLTIAMTIVIISPIAALRRSADASDGAAAAAVARFRGAAHADATNVERTRLDALTHDIIMSTLIVAAQAQSPDVEAAASKAAREALQQLDALMGDDKTTASHVSVTELIRKLQAATATYSVEIAWPAIVFDQTPVIPISLAQALVQATTEAVRNAAIHAVGRIPTVTVSFPHSDGSEVVVDIVDDGPGFNIDAIRPERLGIRTSIIERMQLVRGEATVTSSLGSGTRIQLKWAQGQRNDG